MCGIAGIVAEHSEKYRDAVGRMIKKLIHRGPDDCGLRMFRNCILGHTRLTIIDLVTGQQPMMSQHETRAVIFNGEIYGFKKIKAHLNTYPFVTTSDTEVLLALYEQYGENMMRYLPGMFAFALWDDEQKKLFCARDRFGEKPLYYASGRQGEFIFASEIKALLATDLLKPIISRKAIRHYMQFGYIHPYTTIFKNIHVLPPAHMLTYRSGHISVEQYWDLPRINEAIDLHDAVEIFKELLEEAIKRQLVADVPVGAFLSGGLDSTTVVAIARRYLPNLRTFSFRFGGRRDESPYAAAVAREFKTDHFVLEENKEVSGELLMEMQNIYDEPFADSSNIPTYLISNMAKKYGKVVLTGDGGDELLAGYRWWYRPLLFMEKDFLKYLIIFLVCSVWKRIMGRPRVSLRRMMQEVSKGLTLRRYYPSIAQAHSVQQKYFTESELDEIGLVREEPDIVRSLDWPLSDTVDDAMRLDIQNYLAGDILVKTDRASMANGLELRAPFLDTDFASFCISMPSRLKITARHDKILLRRAYSKIWPQIVQIREKKGFGAPISEWLNRQSFIDLKEKFILNKNNKIFNFLRHDKAIEYATRNKMQTWILLVLSLWMENNSFDAS